MNDDRERGETPMKRRDALKVIATTAVAVPLGGALTPRTIEGRTLPVIDPAAATPNEPLEQGRVSNRPTSFQRLI